MSLAVEYDYEDQFKEALGKITDQSLKKKLVAIKKLVVKRLNLENDFKREHNKLEYEYEEKYKPIYEKRRKILKNQISFLPQIVIPGFSENDYELIRGEYYSELDYLGRCGVVYANIDSSMRPTEERGSIGMIKPSGWNQAKYEGYVDSKPPYLYNRCHLIAYALTGQNANELNLITGTRYFNVTSMLPFEERVMRYLDSSDNHVLYRVTPYFKDEELVARGVEIEAYSIEDNGRGISFHVFVYNYQPGIEINYLTGESWIE